MQPQLFLFDDIKETGHKDLPVVEENLSSLQPEEAADISPAKASDAIEKETEPVADPFAGIQQKKQDEIDNLLLMPANKRGRKSFKAMDEEAILPEVPDDAELYRKQYYSTRTVAEWFGITLSQLRSWENEFDVLQPKKNGRGDRFFRPEDVKNLKLIYHLIRRRKFTVQGAKQYMDENKKKLQTTMQLTESLHKFKQFLLELKAISG